MSLSISKQHWTGIVLSGTSLITGIAGIIGWITKNISAPLPTEVCVNGLPPALGGIITTALPILASVGAFILLLAPSVSDKVNVQAGYVAGKKMSTFPPPPPPPSSNPNPPGAAA